MIIENQNQVTEAVLAEAQRIVDRVAIFAAFHNASGASKDDIQDYFIITTPIGDGIEDGETTEAAGTLRHRNRVEGIDEDEVGAALDFVGRFT